MDLSKIFIAPADPGSLEDVGDVHNDELDGVILEKIRKVLIDNNAENRFGIALLHRHFELASNEKVVEEFVPETRNLVITVKSDDELTAPITPSVVRFTKDS